MNEGDRSMRRKKTLILAAALALGSAAPGCTSAYRAPLMYRVLLYSGGKPVRAWETKGAVHSRNGCGSHDFVDHDSDRFVEVSGTVVIEQLP
jgi:hypothetical protein